MSQRPLRILYDHQIFTKQAFGGVSRYYVELIRRFEVRPDLTVSLSVGDVRTNDLRGMKTFQQLNVQVDPLKRRVIDTVKGRAGVDMLYRSNQRESLRFLRKGDFDLFHPTYYDPYFLKALDGKPFCLVIFDMIHELFPQYFHRNSSIAAWKKQLVGPASSIVTISDNTRDDVIRILGVDPKRVRTIHLGNSLQPQMSDPRDKPAGLPERYILFVGGRDTYKNFVPFVKAIGNILKEDSGLHLVCVGGGKFKESELLLLKELQIGGRTHQMNLKDPSLCQTYTNAKAFVFPSLYEGFGLPVVEAMACGCPTILSNTSSLPEIGGEAAAYFDPSDPSSIEKAVASVVLDESLQQRMKAKGIERARIFDWDRTAGKTRELYAEMMEG